MVRIGKGKEVDHKFDYDTFYKYLADLGDSLLVVNDDEVVKVHVHTEHPGKVMAWGQSFGDLAKVKVDNMRLQQETIIENDAEEAASEAKASENIPETAIIAVASGEGIQTLFKSLGVTHIISGGQTMNPSTEDIVNAINDSQAKEAIILPNNKNIFLSAEQAAEVADIPTKVVHSRSISQGMTALLGFNPESDLDGNTASMEENLSTVKSGEVTHAIRDTELDGIQIKKGDFMGIVDGKIKVTRPDMIDTSVAMVQSMLDEDSEIVTIIYGTDATEEEANKIEDAVMAIDGDLEVEIHEGDQPVYPFVISVE